MKTIKSILAIVLIALSLTSFSQSMSVDVKNSSLKWHGKKVTGEHSGTIQLKEGSLTIENNKITAGEFTVDMMSIQNTDIKDAAYKAKLQGHLKSDDFFGVEKFKTAKLVITNSSAFMSNAANIKANLTIKGITHPVEFEAHKEGLKFVADIVVDRSKFDVKYGSGSFFDGLGDKMIYDEFTLTLVIATANK